MSTLELKVFTLTLNEGEALCDSVVEARSWLSPRFMPKSLEKINFDSSATSFRLRESHCVLLEISELASKIIDLFMTFYWVFKSIFRILRISNFQAVSFPVKFDWLTLKTWHKITSGKLTNGRQTTHAVIIIVSGVLFLFLSRPRLS